MSRSGRQPTAGPCALFLFLTLLISSASDTGPTPTTDLSNRDKHRKPFRFFEDPQRRMSLVLRKLNTTGMIDVRGAVIQLDAEEKETLRTTIALVAALYGLAALYGILHLPVWDNPLLYGLLFSGAEAVYKGIGGGSRLWTSKPEITT
ncbi:uncharacterized protein LOC144819324 isoform X3 [Lissotriton helveticus]